ncbi:hypothetical protein M1403_00970 [Patescibacteria group bacterium]|nr:hypothetical protein [Patescibacteria group bacterium]
MYRTLNKGASWTNSNLGNANSVDIITDPNNQNRIFASVGNTLYRSLDGGDNWLALPLNGGFTGGLIDKLVSDRIYISTDNGFYKSNDGGNSWSKKTVTTGSQFIFRVAQDQNGYLYASVREAPYSVWRSKDFGETWENVGDPAWGSRNTWGLDAAGQRVIVSVEGLGIYYADTVPSESDPVVFIPGFGGSWSYKGIVENQPTTYADWQLMPVFTDSYYQPLLSTLKNAGLTNSGANQNLFTFSYDFRKTITDNAASLNTFLANEVQPKNPGKKVNVIAHSMGSLVVRDCYEKDTGCSDKIGKIVTAGGPHLGTIKAYQLWEGGQADVDLGTKIAMELVLHTTGLPYLSDKDIIQNKMPGVRDLLPVFDYISGKPYSSLSSVARNPNLEALFPLSTNFKNSLTPLSGNNQQTPSGFTTASRNALDIALNLWPDGKPASYTNAVGDGTILKTSSEIAGLAANKYYDLSHNDYFQNTAPLTDILHAFDLTGSIATTVTEPTSYLSFIIHSPATIEIKNKDGSPVGKNLDGKAVFIADPVAQSYQVIISGTGNGNFQLDAFYINNTQTIKRTFSGSITSGATKTTVFNFSSDPGQSFSETNGAVTLTSFRQKVAATNLRNLKIIEATVVAAVNDIQNNRNRKAAFTRLEKANLDTIGLLATDNNGVNRQNLRELSEQLIFVTNALNQQYRLNPPGPTTNSEISRSQSSVNRKLAKSKLTNREASNLLLSQSLLADSNALKNSGKNYLAILFARGANLLSN